MTEFGGVVTILDDDAHRDADHPERLVSAGRPIPGVEVRVVDPATLEDVEPGTAGELWFRTEQSTPGYHGQPEATAELITDDGWVRTGDIGRVDDGGFVFVEDRVKDMIISGGENIYSPEVERVLAEHPSVLELAVIGVPDDKWGESVKAVVAFHPGPVGRRPRSSSSSPASASRTTRRRSRSTSWRRCPATRPARSSSATCASSTGPTRTARSDDRQDRQV